MRLMVRADLHYEVALPCDALLQIEVAPDTAQQELSSSLTLTPRIQLRTIHGEEGIGTRHWFTIEKEFICTYKATFDVSRASQTISERQAGPVSQTPEEVTKYLLPSRYCHPEAFFEIMARDFDGLSGGALVDAVVMWISRHFTYDNTASHGGTTATESYEARAGVCRDYAHVLIAMVRSAGIPARYVSAYGPDVQPQDFHAVVEVFLDGNWHLIDPTGMSQPAEILRIGVGRDAADVSFLTSYGPITLINQSVDVAREGPDVAAD